MNTSILLISSRDPKDPEEYIKTKVLNYANEKNIKNEKFNKIYTLMVSKSEILS